MNVEFIQDGFTWLNSLHPVDWFDYITRFSSSPLNRLASFWNSCSHGPLHGVVSAFVNWSKWWSEKTSIASRLNRMEDFVACYRKSLTPTEISRSELPWNLPPILVVVRFKRVIVREQRTKSEDYLRVFGYKEVTVSVQLWLRDVYVSELHEDVT